MDYCKYEECFDGIKGYTYLEVNDGCVFRQVSKFADRYVSSNIKDPMYDFWLTEGEFKLDMSDEIKIISKTEFEEIWLANNQRVQHKWTKLKTEYQIGMEISGSIGVFYPHGVIINVGNDNLGVADYDECRRSTDAENLYPGHRVEAVIKGYDEKNMWLILEDPKVFKSKM